MSAQLRELESSLTFTSNTDPEHLSDLQTKIDELKILIAQKRKEPKNSDPSLKMSASFPLDPKVEYQVDYALLDESINILNRINEAFKRKASSNVLIPLLNQYVAISQKTIVPKT